MNPDITPLPWRAVDGWRGIDTKNDLGPTRWIQIFGAGDFDRHECDFVWQLEAPSYRRDLCRRVEANANFIITAVNSYDADQRKIAELTEALARATAPITPQIR